VIDRIESNDNCARETCELPRHRRLFRRREARTARRA
jgi:hypothetical protein